MKTSDLNLAPNYFDRYIALVDDQTDIIDALKSDETLFEDVSQQLNQQASYRYAPNKWTPKEIVQHIIDAERIFAYRALSISRSEPKALLGFDENDYAENSNANKRTMDSLLKEFKSVRRATITLFESLDENVLIKTGIASGITVSPLALGFTIVGHAKHHLNVLNERYFN